MTKAVTIGPITVGANAPLMVAAGPCVIESRELIHHVAGRLKEITSQLGLPFVFKASYDKANRTSIRSFRGPRADEGLAMLAELKAEHGVPIISDVHRLSEVEPAAKVLDIIQVPAFLSRQTDLITAVAETGKTINVKKGQFLSPWDVANIIEKIVAAGNENILITERGASFGYNNLVVDMRALPIIRGFGYPVLFDATHSVQLPGGAGSSSGGDRRFIGPLARAAVAAGVDGVFMEVHPEPEKALCDGPNSMHLNDVPEFLQTLKDIDALVKPVETIT
jgi:2-dehydro-3-deoxyphosphooctonate aldolase (KDO 8-P synthase)